MARLKISSQEMAMIPEVELMVDVRLVPDDGGVPEPVYHRSDLDQVLDGEAAADELWQDEADQDLEELMGRRRWMPGAIAAAGVVAVIVGALVISVGQPSAAAERPEVISPAVERSPVTPPPAPVEEPTVVTTTAEPIEEPAAEEVTTSSRDTADEPPRRRRPRARRGASREDLCKQVLEAMGVDSATQPAPAPAPRARRVRKTNTPMFLASRIYRRNKRTLLACDRLAQRRGESLSASRALFRVIADARGVGTVKVTGLGVEAKRLSCYQVMARRWRLPATGETYRTAFKHIN